MRVTRFGHLIALALLISCAPDPSISASPELKSVPALHVADDQGEDAAKDLALVYDQICLAAFPDETKLQKSLASFSAVELNQTEVRALLHDDPGRGWRLPGTPFTVTVESPPYRTCAVRRMTRDGLPTTKPYLAAVSAYSEQHGLLKGAVVRINRRLPSGADTMMWATPLLRPGASQPVEISDYAATNYHGGLDPVRMPDTAGGVGVEVRMAHQLVPTP